MRSRYAMALAAAAGVGLSTITLPGPALAQSETVVWKFKPNPKPYAHVALDPNSGILYGTGVKGGVEHYGIIFQLVNESGVWKETLLHTFLGYDGESPYAGLVEDSAGTTFYGTTAYGGSAGFGTVFELSSGGFIPLYNFAGGTDGANPYGDLTIDPVSGTLYGTTVAGGAQNCGTVFEISPSGAENILYAFRGNPDGCQPFSRVREDSNGTLYGTTLAGGALNAGTVFRLKETNGVWNESVIYHFPGAPDGAMPRDIDFNSTTGTLYGVTEHGGGNNAGTVFDLTKTKGGWRELVLYAFKGDPDGASPYGLQMDHATGALVGTTLKGGRMNQGTLYALSKTRRSWTETILHSFGSQAGDGSYPYARPVEDTKTGFLYGTTNGAAHGGGTVYLVNPSR